MLFFRISPNTVTDRFLVLFAWHNIPVAYIPRLITQISYRDLESSKSLLAALTPEIIDQVARLFGVRSQWLEGSDDLILLPFGERGSPGTIVAQLAAVDKAAKALGVGWHRPALCILTTTTNLDPKSSDQQWLVPVVLEPIDTIVDGPIYRGHVFGHYYDWTATEDRLELKAITWLVWHHFRCVVPLFQVSEDELQNIVSGQSIPSMVFSKPIVTHPSLEDFIETPEESRVAKETDELPQVLAYLDATRLKDRWREAIPLPSRTARPEVDVAQEVKGVSPTEPAKPDAGTPTKPGKRQAQQAAWDAILAAAQTIWAEQPNTTYAEMIQRLKAMLHLKASALSDSAIHKRLRPIAPSQVRGKSGRKPK